MKTNLMLIVLCVAVVTFSLGRFAGAYGVVRADSTESPQIDIRQISGGSSLVVYYPDLKKMFVYQPFAGQPIWPCQYSIQLSTPGGAVERQACPGN